MYFISWFDKVHTERERDIYNNSNKIKLQHQFEDLPKWKIYFNLLLTALKETFFTIPRMYTKVDPKITELKVQSYFRE